MKTYIYVLVMAVTTYLVRALPLTLFKKPIKSRFIRSFLHYVPAACLAAMTFPAILYATDCVWAGAAGLVVGILLAIKSKSLILVSVASCAVVFIVDRLATII